MVSLRDKARRELTFENVYQDSVSGMDETDSMTSLDSTLLLQQADAPKGVYYMCVCVGRGGVEGVVCVKR